MASHEWEFMKNDKWHYFDNVEYFAFRLTKEAPKEVYKSYKTYLEDALYLEEISEYDYKELLEELENFEQEKIKNLFGV